MSLYKGDNLISGAMPNSANQSLSNLDSAGQDKFDAKVNKSGDTMTGPLIVSNSENSNQFIAQGMQIDKTVTPTINNLFSGLKIIDKNSAELGSFYYRFDTAGEKRSIISCIGNNKSAYIIAGLDANETPYSIFPNTTCVDGQWIQIANTTVVSTSVAAGTSGAYTDHDISNLLPSDSHKYEVSVEVMAQTGSTNGSYMHCWVTSPETNTLGVAASIRTPAANFSQTRGRGPVPLGTSKKLRVYRSCTGSQGTISVTVLGYRRIGTNE